MLIWSKLSTFLHFEELFGNKQEFSVIEKKKWEALHLTGHHYQLQLMTNKCLLLQVSFFLLFC